MIRMLLAGVCLVASAAMAKDYHGKTDDGGTVTWSQDQGITVVFYDRDGIESARLDDLTIAPDRDSFTWTSGDRSGSLILRTDGRGRLEFRFQGALEANVKFKVPVRSGEDVFEAQATRLLKMLFGEVPESRIFTLRKKCVCQNSANPRQPCPTGEDGCANRDICTNPDRCGYDWVAGDPAPVGGFEVDP